MTVKRALATASIAALIPLAVIQPGAQAMTPPPTGCAAQLLPGPVLTVAGNTIAWGAPRGVARVHSTVRVKPTTVPEAWTITYTWTVGDRDIVSGNRYRFGWSDYGKQVRLAVVLSGRCGAYAKHYDFGVVATPSGSARTAP